MGIKNNPMKTKNSLRINGTTFNKKAVAEMTKEVFMKQHSKVDVVMPNEDVKKREEKLGEAYDVLTKK